jgi:hypothetical protein
MRETPQKGGIRTSIWIERGKFRASLAIKTASSFFEEALRYFTGIHELLIY